MANNQFRNYDKRRFHPNHTGGCSLPDHHFHLTEQPMESVNWTAGVLPASIASMASFNSLVVALFGSRGLS
ncbi:MAG: hypothetical protein VXY42_02970, partial [Candidatus Thermoplasmatota archaeon]|nr:hypothetical protein [Candidatus Thermoplasmatota archaeon]